MLNSTAVKVAMKVPKGNKFSRSCLDRAPSCITQTLVGVLCTRPIRKNMLNMLNPQGPARLLNGLCVRSQELSG